MSMCVGGKQWRKTYARLKAGRCIRHNAPIVPNPRFDGGDCPFGCVSINTLRFYLIDRMRREKKAA